MTIFANVGEHFLSTITGVFRSHGVVSGTLLHNLYKPGMSPNKSVHWE